jgi:hypothetical protein
MLKNLEREKKNSWKQLQKVVCQQTLVQVRFFGRFARMEQLDSAKKLNSENNQTGTE